MKSRTGMVSVTDQFPVFMTVVMKCNKLAVIGVNAGSCDHRTSEITANVFDYMRRAAVIRQGANIKTIFMIRIDRSLKFFKRVWNVIHSKERSGKNPAGVCS